MDTELKLHSKGTMRKPEVKLGLFYQLILQDYIDNEQKSRKTVEYQIKKHLKRMFPEDRSAARIATKDLEAYKTARRAEGAAPATVNLELATLRRGYNLAIDKDLFDRRYMPKFNLYRIGNKNRKQGFFEHHEYEKILLYAKPYLRQCFRFGYIVGWRETEIFKLTWAANYNEEQQELRIYDSKNGDGRVLPLVDEHGELNDLGIIIEEQKRDRRSGVPFIFHYDGRKLNRSTFCKHQREAGKAAGINKTFHDFRRTASRNLRNKGVDQADRMMIIGHRTTDMDLRYGIVSKTDMQRAISAVSLFKKKKGGSNSGQNGQNSGSEHGGSHVQNSSDFTSKMAERVGFEPTVAMTATHDFQSDSSNEYQQNPTSTSEISKPTTSKTSRVSQLAQSVRSFLNSFTNSTKKS